MKVRISPTGNLEIFRKYEYKVQTCCYHQYKACGDHCPMFDISVYEYRNFIDSRYQIILCHNKSIIVDLKDFQDLRAKQEKERDYVFKDFEGNI